MAFAAAAGFACAFVVDAAAVSAASSEMAPSVGFHAAADPDDDEKEDGLRRRFSVGAASSGAAAGGGAGDVGGRRARLTKANSFMCARANVWRAPLVFALPLN